MRKVDARTDPASDRFNHMMFDPVASFPGWFPPGPGDRGVVYWEPAWVSTQCSTRWGKGSHWENSAFFDYERTSAHSGFDFLSHSYSLPVPVQFRFTCSDREVAAPLCLWASFLEGNDFAIKLEPENGEFSYIAMLPAGARIQCQLCANPDIEGGLLPGGAPQRDGVISAAVGDDGLVVIESLDRESLDGQ